MSKYYDFKVCGYYLYFNRIVSLSACTSTPATAD